MALPKGRSPLAGTEKAGKGSLYSLSLRKTSSTQIRLGFFFKEIVICLLIQDVVMDTALINARRVTVV